MPFHVNDTINNIGDSVLGFPMVMTVAKNPLYTALFIAVILVLITIFVFRDVDADEPVYVIAMRGGFWAFLATLGIVFVHNKVLHSEISAETKGKNYDDMFTGSYSGLGEVPDSLNDFIVPIEINAAV